MDLKLAAVEISFLAKSQHASGPPGCVRDPIDDIAYQAKFCAPPGLQIETSRLGVIRQIKMPTQVDVGSWHIAAPDVCDGTSAVGESRRSSRAVRKGAEKGSEACPPGHYAADH